MRLKVSSSMEDETCVREPRHTFKFVTVQRTDFTIAIGYANKASLNRSGDTSMPVKCHSLFVRSFVRSLARSLVGSLVVQNSLTMASPAPSSSDFLVQRKWQPWLLRLLSPDRSLAPEALAGSIIAW